MIRAGAHGLEGKSEATTAELDRAVGAFEREGMRLYELSARHARACAADPASSDHLDEIEALGVKNPTAMVRLLAPGCLPRGR